MVRSDVLSRLRSVGGELSIGADALSEAVGRSTGRYLARLEGCGLFEKKLLVILVDSVWYRCMSRAQDEAEVVLVISSLQAKAQTKVVEFAKERSDIAIPRVRL